MSKQMFNQHIDQISISKIRDFNRVVSPIEGIVKLTLGEPGFNTPEVVKQAAKTSIDNNESFYTSMVGLSDLRKSACDFQRIKYGLDYDPNSEMLVTVGVSEAIATSLISILNPGDKVLLPSPAYPGYIPLITLQGAQVIEIDTSTSDFKLTPAQLEDAFAEHGDSIKAIILNYPANPTGTILTKEQMQGLADVLTDKHVHIISDEVYSELNYTEHEHASIAHFLPQKTIVLNGMSKSHAMTGWRIGFIFAPKFIIEQFTKTHQYLVTAATTFCQRATVTALKKGSCDVKKMKNQYQVHRNILYDALSELGFAITGNDGTFYLFAKIPADLAEKLGVVSGGCVDSSSDTHSRQTVVDSWQFALALAEKVKVAAVPGIAFGRYGEGFLRFSYSVSLDDIKIAIKRLNNFFKN